jgi:hypothetical protein
MQPIVDETAEMSPLWGLVLVLAEIAERVERRHVEEHEPTLPQVEAARPTPTALDSVPLVTPRNSGAAWTADRAFTGNGSTVDDES